jgi:hypothetical protein
MSKTITTPKDHTLDVGQILESMWGYDQTNVDFYEVIKVTRTTVIVRKLRTEAVEQRSHMSSTVTPKPEDYAGESFRRKVITYGSSPFIQIESYANAHPWNGQPRTATHYA